MNVALGSMIRNGTGYLDRYASQVRGLAQLLADRGDTLRLVIAEGDSTDRTWQRLGDTDWGHARFFAIKREHGGPAFGSVNVQQRWLQISWVVNGVLDELGPADDQFIWVESDLIWQPETMVALLDHLETVPAVTCMVWAHGEAPRRFYDTWGMRGIDGGYGQPYAPYHPSLAGAEGLVEILSNGSCIVTRGEAARSARYDPPDEAIVSWCLQMRENGYPLFMDPSLAVEHP